MTFPSTGTTLADGLASARGQAANIKAICSRYATTMASTSVSSAEIFYVLDSLISAKAVFAQIAALPGIDAYAQAQLGASVVADFAAMNTAIQNAGAWVMTNFPKSSDNFLLAEGFNADGTRALRNFTTAQMAGLVPLLTAVSATIA